MKKKTGMLEQIDGLSKGSVSAYTVSELTRLIRTTFDEAFEKIWVEGEVSGLRVAKSGHTYFTLKDSKSAIRGVIFRSFGERLKFQLEDGLHVVCQGRLAVYESRGEYQIVINSLEPKGVGARQLALEQLKTRLAEEGLFDISKKRPLPMFPRQIGLITSAGGAVVWDVIDVVHRRLSLVKILICHAAVQGSSAGQDIVRAIRALNREGGSDILIVARGGGAAEDLWTFNEEKVARAIYESSIPVISAVGHEVDFTVADLVADYRAPTPSAAAEAATPDRRELINRLQADSIRLSRSFRRALQGWQDRVESVNVVRLDPRIVLLRHLQRVDELETRINIFIENSMTRMSDHTRGLLRRFISCTPTRHTARLAQLLSHLMFRKKKQIRAFIETRRVEVESLAARLNSLSPLSVLERGYTIARRWPSLKILKSVTAIRSGDTVQVQFSNGSIICEVRDLQNDVSP